MEIECKQRFGNWLIFEGPSLVAHKKLIIEERKFKTFEHMCQTHCLAVKPIETQG